MSDSLIEKACGYAAEWQNRLHLTDWSVKVGRGETSRDEWLASSRTNWRDMIGSITIPPTYEAHLERESDLRRHVDLDRELECTVLHELLHIAWSPRITDLRDAVHETLGEGGRAPILSALEKAEEFAVNMMTRALLDQKYPPRGDEKSSESTTAILDRGNCPDCTHQPTPPPSRNDPPYGYCLICKRGIYTYDEGFEHVHRIYPTPPPSSFHQPAVNHLVRWTVAEYDRNVHHGETACDCENCCEFRSWVATHPFSAPELFKPQ